MTESTILTALDVRSWLRPCVYIARLGDRVQYIGQSSQGILRPLDPQHHVISLPTFEYDTLEIIWLESEEQALALESELIFKHSPPFNTRGVAPLDTAGDACRPCLWFDPSKRDYVVLARRTPFEKRGVEILRTKDRAEAKQRLRDTLKAENIKARY
jgi:hypothetical protein